MAGKSYGRQVRDQIRLCSEVRGQTALREWQEQEGFARAKARKLENRYRLEALMESFEVVFGDEDKNFVEDVRNSVFQKWRNLNYVRDATLAPQDIARVVKTYPDEFQKRFEELRPSFEELYNKRAVRALIRMELERKANS